MKPFLWALAVVLFLAVPLAAGAHVAVDTEYLHLLGLREGDIVGSSSPDDPDIYIVNDWGFKRLFLSPTIFSFYGHLRFDAVKRFGDTVIESMPITGLFRNCETGDERVYALEVTSEDDAVLHWVNVSGTQVAAEDDDFFRKVFCINSREFSWYRLGSPYTSLAQVPRYTRVSAHGLNDTLLPLTVPSGLRISVFASGLGPVRFMAFSPDGILFATVPSVAGLYGGGGTDTGTVLALTDTDRNGSADSVRTVLSGLHLPHGLAFYGGYLYVAQEGSVLRYSYTNGGVLGQRETIVTDLPTGGEHLSRTLGFSPSGKMYVSVGSSCNNCSPAAAGTGAIWEFNADGTGKRLFATGIRNAVGFVFQPTTGQMWATENSRDFLGDNLPPDEINIIRDGGGYGWPHCYGANIVDPAYRNAALCQGTVPSVHDLQAHSAPLGLAFISGTQFPSQWQGDLVVARHGSWNRSVPVGYDVVRLDVQGSAVVSEQSLVSGWLTSDRRKLGRPVDVVFGPDGILYISDDSADMIYRVSKAP